MVGGGTIPEKAPVVGFEQGMKRCLAGEKSRGIIKKSFTTVDLGDFQESNSTWHETTGSRMPLRLTPKVLRPMLG